MHATVHKSSSGARTSLERLHAEMQDEHRLRRVQGPMSLTALGELLAWILGWDLIVEYAKACATVAASWSHDLDELLRITVGWHSVDPHNWTGISVTTRHMPADPTAKWGLIGQLGLNSWLTPVDDAVRSQFAPYGLSGIMLGTAIVFFAFIGFDSISTHAEQAKRPQRDVPIAILVSLVVCTVLHVAVAAVITGTEPYRQIDVEAAVAATSRRLSAQHDSLLLRASAALIAAGALAGMTSVLLVTFLSQARLLLAMSRDGLLPPM